MKTGQMIKVVALALALALSNLGAVLAAPQTRPTSAGQPSGKTTPAAETMPGLRVVESKKDYVTLELSTPDFRLEQGTSDDGPCDLITVADYGETDESGWPRLPVQGAMVGIPPQADVILTVVKTEGTVLPERLNLCPVPTPIVEIDIEGEIKYEGEESIQNADAYASASFYPNSQAEIGTTGFARGKRVAQVYFYPFQYNPASGELRQYHTIVVRLAFSKAETGGEDDRGGRSEGPPGRDQPPGKGLQKAKRWFDPKSAELALVPTSAEEDTFGESVAPTVVNQDVAQEWYVQPELLASEPVPEDHEQISYKIMVDEDGIYEVNYDDLLAAGVDTGLDPRTLKLHNQGEEVAIYVAGEEDGSFDPGDTILFYGQKMNTKYTDVNVYWLTWNGTGGRRMAVVDGNPSGLAPVPTHFLATQHLEEDHSYFSNYPSGPDDDRWYWNYVLANESPAATTFDFTLQHVATRYLDATVRGLFRGYSANQHHTRVYINGRLIDDATWYSQETHAFDISIPQSYLVEGANTLTVEAPLDGGITQDIVLINWFEIDYHRVYLAGDGPLFFQGDAPGTWEFLLGGFATDNINVFDISSPTDPSRVTNIDVWLESGGYSLAFEHAVGSKRYYVALTDTQRGKPMNIERDRPSDLASTVNGADYVIISHGDFYTDVLPLAAHRADRGMRTKVVDVQDIYDEFSYGVFEPEAIRDFLAYAYVNWSEPAPAYVVLIGDGNYDFKDNYGRGEPNYIPPYLAPIDLWIGEVAADNRYVCVSGDDIFPDMHLGRLPVKTSAEAAAVVAKIINYEQNPASGDWSRNLLFVTDNPDSAGDFYAYSDAVADHYVPAPYTTQKVYYGLTHSTSSGARAAITSAINEGQLIVNYVGHGSTQQWASERLFGLSYIPALSNDGRLPLMVAMACLDGYYTHPSSSSRDSSATAEAVVRAPGKGAIAAWSATGLGLAYAHDYLNKGLFEAIFFNDVVELGPATTQGKLYLYSRTRGYRDQIDQYTLFGDPALRLNVPPSDVGITQAVEPSGSVQSGDIITFTLTYFNAGLASAHHVIISDKLPLTLHDVSVASTDASITLREDSRFIWDVATLAPGEGGTITITASVNRWFTGMLANTATIATTTPESDTANNTTTTVVAVQKPDFLVIPVEAGLDQDANEGESVSFRGSFDDGGRPEVHTITWDFGDGETATGTLNPVHTYVDDGIYTVTLTVTDDYGWQGSDASIVTVGNVAPVVKAQATPSLAHSRQAVTFRVAVADPGSLDTHTIWWDFGDGSSATSDLATTHAYTSGGVYTATVTAADDDGGIDRAVVTVAIYHDLSPITIHIDTAATAEVGQELEIRNGVRSGQFGWLSWTGDQSVETLARSLALPGDSESYVNPDDSGDMALSPGDWVYGVRRTKSVQALDNALNALKGTTIIVPVWDQVERKGSSLKYHIVGFARVEVVTHSLRGPDRISVVYLGYAPCPEQVASLDS